MTLSTFRRRFARSSPTLLGLTVWLLMMADGRAQIGGTGWTAAPLNFKVQWPYNTNESSRYWLSNNVYHCLVYSNDVPFQQGSTTLPRTEQRFNPDYTSGEIQYQATMMAPGNENSYCVFQIHTGDAQSAQFGSTTFMLFWFTSDGGSVHDYSGTELAKNLANQWFQVNVDHNLVTHTIRVWINKKLVWTQQDNGATDFYMKDGVYEQSHGPTLQMDTYITNTIQFWTSSGTNPPAPPDGVTASAVAGQVSLAWNSSVAATNYNVKRSTSNGGPYTTITTTAGTNYVDTGVTNGTTYYYVITALDSFGESANSTQVNATPANAGFQLGASPASAAIVSGTSTNFTVTMTTNASFTGTTTFGVSGLPTGASANFVPASLNNAGTTALTIQTTTNTPGGNYALTIVGTNGINVISTGATLSVSGLAANPGTLEWTAGSGTDTNWSTIRNWTNITSGGLGPPGPINSVLFTNVAAASASALTAPGSGVIVPGSINTFVDATMSIGSMTNFANAANTSQNFENIGIAPGATLTLTNTLQVGGSTNYDFGANNMTTLTVAGSGGTLSLSGGGATISSDSASAGAHDAILDLSGLGTFTMTGTQIRLGVEGSGNAHHASGICYLAATNIITLTSAGYTTTGTDGASPYSGNPALYIGHNSSAFGLGSQLYLGLTNALFLDYATIGRGDTNALLAFNPAFLSQNPVAFIRGTNGVSSRVGVYVVGDVSPGAQSNNAPSTNDFSGGNVDALINYMCVGRGRNGNSSSTGGSGVLTFDTGAINANTLALGFLYVSGSNSQATGTVNLNGSATLSVNSNLLLGSQVLTTNAVPVSGQGTINLNGGTLLASNIVGAGISTINLNSGTIDLQSTNPAPGVLTNISTLLVGTPASGDAALLTGAGTITVSNPVTISANGTIAGNTTITTPGMTVNGGITPGSGGAGGFTNNGPVTLGGGGQYNVTVLDATAGPAAGWGFWKVNGSMNVQSTGGNPFVITVQTAGSAANFNYHTNYDWVVATVSGGILNFDATKFLVDDSQFQNDLGGGYFYVHTSGNSLVLSFTNNHPPTAGIVMQYKTGATMAIPVAGLSPQWSDPDGNPVALLSVNTSSTNGSGNVGTDGAFIYYTNANNVADAIHYTVQDVRTNPPAVYRVGDTVQTGVGTIVLVPPPGISTRGLSGNNLVIGGSGGIPNRNFYTLTSTNIALPLAAWARVATNVIDGNGIFGVTNPVNAGNSRQFYTLQLQ